jgi:uncharacterized protein
MRAIPLRFTVVLIIGLVSALLAGCDSRPGAGGSPAATGRQVTVIGNGKVDGTPDTLTADAAISFVASDVTTAMNQTNERQQAVIEALVNAGIDRKDIATSSVTLQPQYGSDGTTISGYQAGNAITVTIRDIGSASRVLAIIVATGGNATRLNSVNFSINDDSQLLKDARARAFNDARDRAEQYAELSGLSLGKVITISEAPGAAPPPVPLQMPRGPMVAAAAPPIEPGQQTVSFAVTVVWELG